MARALSVDLRRRVVGAIEGGLSCRAAAERFGVSPSSTIRWRAQEQREGAAGRKAAAGVCGATAGFTARRPLDAGASALARRPEVRPRCAADRLSGGRRRIEDATAADLVRPSHRLCGGGGDRPRACRRRPCKPSGGRRTGGAAHAGGQGLLQRPRRRDASLGVASTTGTMDHSGTMTASCFPRRCRSMAGWAISRRPAPRSIFGTPASLRSVRERTASRRSTS